MKKNHYLTWILLILLTVVVVFMGIWMCRVAKQKQPPLTEEQKKESMIERIQPAQEIDEGQKAEMINSIQKN